MYSTIFEKWQEPQKSIFYLDFSWRFSVLTNQGSLGFRASHGGQLQDLKSSCSANHVHKSPGYVWREPRWAIQRFEKLRTGQSELCRVDARVACTLTPCGHFCSQNGCSSQQLGNFKRRLKSGLKGLAIKRHRISISKM